MVDAVVVKGVVYCIIFGVGLLQLPLLVDIAANLFPRYDIKRWSNRVVGGILMATCAAVAGGGYWLWCASVLPLWLHPVPMQSTEGVAHLVLGTWLWLLTMTNYLAASLTPPGAAPVLHNTEAATTTTTTSSGTTTAAPTPPSHADNATTHLSDDALLASMPSAFFCRHCQKHRAPTSFHCHDCGACGADVDHHCPFVNVCVGRDNYRYFALFLFYAMLGMLYCSIITFPPFYSCWVASSVSESSSIPGSGGEPPSARFREACAAHPEYTLVFLGVLGLGVAIGNLSAAQVVLLLADIRTVDSLRFLRQRWNLWPILTRAWACRGLQPGSNLRTLLFSPGSQWWHFVVPGKWSPSVKHTKLRE
eukprot:m.203582 g.203582  ORF g.203582 m.203582 type:complete len:363 (-) comp22162_c0_seq1:77-1165(-)